MNRYLERVQEQSQRLEALVKSLLDLSRIEAAEFKFNLAPIDFSQLVREVSEQFASRAEQTDHEFEVGPDCKKCFCNRKPGTFRQVMINLLENALKFTPGTV